MLKTYADWEGTLDEYLTVGCLVDQEMVNYFLNVLPPTYWSGYVIQLGEPSSHIGGKATYETLEKTNLGWTYAGVCFKGQTKDVRRRS